MGAYPDRDPTPSRGGRVAQTQAVIAACTLAARQNARTAARRLHAQLAGVAASLDPIEPREVIESLLGAEAHEDLVAVYRQTAFELLLVARGRSTPGYG